MCRFFQCLPPILWQCDIGVGVWDDTNNRLLYSSELTEELRYLLNVFAFD